MKSDAYELNIIPVAEWNHAVLSLGVAHYLIIHMKKLIKMCQQVNKTYSMFLISYAVWPYAIITLI